MVKNFNNFRFVQYLEVYPYNTQHNISPLIDAGVKCKLKEISDNTAYDRSVILQKYNITKDV